MTTATKITYTSAAGDLNEFHHRFDEALGPGPSRSRCDATPTYIGGEPVDRAQPSRSTTARRSTPAAARPLRRSRAGGGGPRGPAGHERRSATGAGNPGRSGSRSCGGPPR